MKIHSFKVTPDLPDNMKFLEELSNNMWFAWNLDAINLFVKIDEKLWEQSLRMPKWLMATVSQSRLEELSRDKDFIAQLNYVESLYRNYQKEQNTWFNKIKGEGKDNFLTAYQGRRNKSANLHRYRIPLKSMRLKNYLYLPL